MKKNKRNSFVSCTNLEDLLNFLKEKNIDPKDVSIENEEFFACGLEGYVTIRGIIFLRR